MRRSLLVVLTVSALIAALLGLVTNYASERMPPFFEEDPWRVWLVLALLAEAAIIMTLIATRLQATPVPAPPSRDALRRAKFAHILWQDVHHLEINEEWRDSHFTELEAEVEVEAPARSWFRRRAGALRVERLPSLTDALRASDERLIILEGEPGAGKSIALRHLSGRMADEARHRPSEQGVLPIYVNLKDFAVRGGVTSRDVEAFVLESLNPSRSRDIDRYLNDRFESDRERGRWLFLFDSFDEIPAILSATEAGPVIDDYIDAIAGFVGLGKSRAIIASREFRGPGRGGRPLFRVMPLSRERRERFIRNADLDAGAEQTLLDGLDGMELQVQQLTDNPLFLSLLCEYVRDTSVLPQSTHAVIESYVRSRMSRDQDRIENRFAVDVEATRLVAEEMAFVMLAEPDLGLSTDRAVMVARLADRTMLSADEVDSAISALLYCHLARYADSEGRSRITFSHRRLQEYFATCAVIRDESSVTPVQLLTDGRWRETAVVILQTQRSEHSADLLTAIEHRLWAALDDRSAVWPPGTLYLLDLMADALTPEDIAQHPVSRVATRILGRAWARGGRLDRKWVVELCAASGAEKAAGFLERAFAGESVWVRDEAYRQVRRVGPAAARLEPALRQMLVDMSVGGRLRRERRSTRIQIQRLPFTGQLPGALDLLVVAPFAAFLAGPLGFAPLIALAPETGRQGLWFNAAVAAAGLLFATWLLRLGMSSPGVVERRIRTRIGGLAIPPYVFVALLFGAGMITVSTGVLVLTGVGSVLARMVREGSPASMVANTAAVAVAFGLWLWPVGALWAATEGPSTQRRLWPLLSLAFAREAAREITAFFRRLGKRHSIRRMTVRALIGLAVLAVPVGWLVAMFRYPRVATVTLWVVVPLACLSIAPVIVLAASEMWSHRCNRRIVRDFVTGVGRAGPRETQSALDRLRDQDGVHRLLMEIRRHKLHKDPEMAEFLAFLGTAFERRKRLQGYAGKRPDWLDWWRSHGSDHAVLSRPSSGTMDELGRLLEEAQRADAFQE